MDEREKNLTTDERLDRLEQAAHSHEYVEKVDCNPEKAEALNTKIQSIKMSREDTEKAKKKGGIFGDPIVSIE